MELPRVEWLGHVPYRDAWALQHEMVDARARDALPDTLLLVEHEPVLTLGRQADPAYVLALPEELARRGIELIRVERGGEVTYHGPGQLVGYPIVRLADRAILLRPFVRALEDAMAEACASYGVLAARRDGFPGCWAAPIDTGVPRKLGALGLRVERGITYHGIALNVTTCLADFALIDPCGLGEIEVTSIAHEAGWQGAEAQPSTRSVAEAAARFGDAFGARLAAATASAAVTVAA